MRITTNMKFNMSTYNLSIHNERLNDLQQQISTGKKILKPSDDPLGMVSTIKLTIKQKSIETYANNLNHAKTNLLDSETALSNVSKILERFKELSVRAANGSLNENDRKLIANEMHSLIEQVISHANHKNINGYIFSGSKTNIEPFLAMYGIGINYSNKDISNDLNGINEVLYNGDKSIININENENFRIPFNVDGETAFLNVSKQIVYSNVTFDNIDKKPLADNLKTGYFTIKGNNFEEIIKVNENDSLQDVINKINQSQIVYAKIIKDGDKFRLSIESREKGVSNQFKLIEGATNTERIKTNFLDILGLKTSINTIKNISDFNSKIASNNELSEISSGRIVINGYIVNIDVKNDSLDDVINKINDKVKNVYAYKKNGKIFFESTGEFIINEDTTKLFEVLQIPKNRYVSSTKISNQVVGATLLSYNEWVKNGNFIINGKNIGILNANSETLYDIVNKINNTPDINANAVITNDGRIVISSTNSQPLSFKDGTSEFLKSFGFELSLDGKSLSSNVLLTSPMLKSNLGSIGVTDGILTINNVNINYAANDTLSDIANKINNNVANVYAYVNSNNILVIDSNITLDIKDNGNLSEKLSLKSENIVDNMNRINLNGISEKAQSLFDILIEIRNKILSGDINGLALEKNVNNSKTLTFKSGLFKLDEAISHIAQVREKVGSSLSIIERSITKNSEMEFYVNKLLTETEGVDFEKAVLELNTVDLIYKSSLQVMAKLNQQSLLDFLR